MRLAAIAVVFAGCAIDVPTADWKPAADREERLAISSTLVPATPKERGSSLRVVSYNVELGERVERLTQLFSSPPMDQADVFLLQEIESKSDEEGSRAERIASATGMSFVYLPSRTTEHGDHGIAILARHSLSNVRFIDLPAFNTSIRNDGRVALAVSVDDVDIVNIHLRLQLGISERVLQMGPATRDLAALAIIGGDFNTNPYGWADMLPVVPTEPISDWDIPGIIDGAMSELGLPNATSESGATHRSPAGELRLDSIYARGLELSEVRVERGVDLSDHWPLWADFAVE